jgi:thimet oligopeptidase
LGHGGGGETPWASADVFSALCAEALGTAKSIREQVASPSTQRTVEGTLQPFNSMLIAMDTAGGLSSLLFQVHPEASIREAAQKCQQELAAFETELYLDRRVYDAIASTNVPAEDGGTTRLRQRLLRDFRKAGVDRDEATRTRLAAISAELVKLGQDYQENVRADVRTVKVPASALAGLPQDFVDAHPAQADGTVELSTDYPDFIPIQTYSTSEAARKELYIAFLQRAWPANRDVLGKVLSLREEYAKLLGFPNWADYFAQDKMVKNAATVEGFIRELDTAVRPRADREVKELLDIKRKDDPKASALEVWDRFYYVAKARELTADFDARAVRPYFPYAQVKQGILDVYSELFGLKFERLLDEPVWHPSVEAYAMSVDGKLMGRFYLDMHPRENKFKHAAMFPMQTGLSTGRIPIASLVCNFPEPVAGEGKALMEHSDVVTFFHEFGHLIHHLLASGTPWLPLSGLNVEWDFVETPSQLLEEWAWDPRVLQRFARHVETGEPIPAELVQRMRKAEDVGQGLHVMRQLHYTAYSYFLHTASASALDLDAFSTEIDAKYSPYPMPQNAYLYANFGHLIGYTSAYYTYQWSLVIAKDLLTRFHKEGLLNPKTAADYRRIVLEPGATRDAAELVEEFLGRPYSIDAYRQWLDSESSTN